MKIKRPFAKKTDNIKNEDFKKTAETLKEYEKSFNKLGDVLRDMKRIIKIVCSKYKKCFDDEGYLDWDKITKSNEKNLEKLRDKINEKSRSIENLGIPSLRKRDNEKFEKFQEVYNKIRSDIGLPEKSLSVK